MLQFDASELRSLATSFAVADRGVAPSLAPIVKKAAQNIKDDWASRASGIGHAPHYPRSISYDFVGWARGARAEIGPDKSRTQGALGNILEYGTSKNPPRPDGAAALEAEQPKFEKALAEAAADALRRAL